MPQKFISQRKQWSLTITKTELPTHTNTTASAFQRAAHHAMMSFLNCSEHSKQLFYQMHNTMSI